MLRNFDLDLDMSKIGKDLKVQLALPNKKIIKNIKNITNASIDEVELNGLPIFTFEIPHKVEIVDFDTDNIEIVDNDDINNIKEEMLIKVTWYNGTKVNWFRVSDITKEENEENTFMVVESKSLPSELRATNVSINKESIDIIEYFETVLYQSPWKLGTVSDKLKNTYRSFDYDKKTRYEAVMSGVETFGAILDWDEENRVLNLKSIDDIREFRGVVLKRENYASSVSVQSSSEEIVTRLYGYGNEGLGIENSNPSGMPYIEDFSYFMSPFKRDDAKNVLSSSNYMSDELCHALLDLEDLKAEYNPKIQNLQNMINSAYTDLSSAMLELQEKQGQLITLQALLDTAKSTNDTDLIYQREMEIRDKELEISTLEENIENIKISIEEWDRQIFNFQQLISTSSFTTELIDELSLFVYEKEFNDDRYIDSQELYEASLEQMEKYQSPVKSFSIDLDSFINSLESQVFNGRLQIGEEVIIKSNKLNMEYRSIILGYNVDFESGHFELNISDNLDDISALDKLASIIYKAESSSTILNNNKYKWDGITNVVDEVSKWRDKEISTVENRITAGANESIVIDNRGIQAHNPDFPDERLIMQSGVIALSKDGGKTWNTSITPDGVIAETIIGKLFAGNNLIITNESGSFVIDSTGLNVDMDSIKIMSGSESNPKDMIDLWNNLLLTYQEILDDGLITQHEKNQLQKQWSTIVDINSSILEVFEKAWKDLEDSEPADSPKPKPKPKEYNDYILAYSELDNYLNITIQSDGYAILDKDNREETTQVDSIVFAQKFKNYNEKKTMFESIIPLEFSNGKIEVLENGISLTYTKNSEIVTMLNLSEEGVRIDGKLLEINSRTEFNADLVMNAGVIKGADDGIIIDLNEGTIELNKPIKIGLGSNLVTKDDLEALELEAYTVVLSNDNSFITTDKDGNNGDFSNAVSTITVYKGATDDTSNWNITAVKSNGVVGALSGRTYTVTNVVGDSGKVIFTATHKSNSELSLSKDFDIIKTKAGLDGEDGKIKNINLVSDGYVISYKGEQPLPAKQTIKMQAFTDGLEGIVVWEIVPYKNNIAQSPITKSVVNNTIEINESDFANSVDMMKVKITCDELIDTATIVKIMNGLDGDSGKDGIAGKDGKGIKSTVIDYATSASGTTKPATDKWEPTVPSLTKGQYLWTRTIWIYTDNTNETGYSVSYIAKDGNTGKDGIAGKDGVGISSTEIEYAGSTSGTTKPTSGWGPAIPTVAEGNYLWTKTTWSYTDDTNEVGYSVAKMGAKGVKGEDGSDAKLLYLSATAETMTFNADNSPNPTTQTISFTANLQNTTGTATFTATPYNGTTALTNIALGGSGNTRTLTQAQFPATATRIQITATLGNLTDTVSVMKLKNGKDGGTGAKGETGSAGANGKNAVVGYLTNESVTFPATSAGVVSSGNLALANGTFKVFDGLTDKTGSSVTYSVVSSTGATGAITTAGIYSVSAITADNASIVFRAVYSGVNIDKILTLSKSKAGLNGYTPVKGTDYFDGKDGANGVSSYLWIMYSQNANGSSMVDSPTDAKYIGVATTTINTKPTAYSDYKWSLVKGTNGVKGETGANGQTSYLHIKYSNDGGTTFTANNGESVGKWIGTYVDFTEADSTLVSKYTWNKVVGEDGADSKLLYLSATAEVMTFNSDNTPNPATQTITFTANMQNATGTATFTAIPYNGTTAMTAITLGGSGNTRTLTQSQFPATATRIQITATLGGLTDTVSVVKLKNGATGGTGATGATGSKGADGKNAIVGYLTNENVTFPANSSGVVTSANLVMANGVFKVFDGLTEKTGSGVTYSVATQTGATGAITTAGAYSVSAISADNASITFRAIYNGATIDKVLTLSKSKEGVKGETGAKGATGSDGVSPIVGLLTNESITLPASSTGVVPSFTGATGTFNVYEGTVLRNASTSAIYSVVSQSGITVSITQSGVYTVSAMTTGTSVLSGTATLRVVYGGVTVDKILAVTKALAGSTGATGATGGKGDTGATGASATSYWITASNNIIGKSQTGVINPTTITFKGFSKTGTANPVAYSGRFIIQTSTNGTTYTTGYTTPSNTNQSSHTYTIPANILFIKCLFYMAGGTTVLLDEQTVPIVESAEGIQVGGENLILNSSKLFLDQLAGGANKEFGWILLGQSYINVPAGTDIVISFDLEMVVNTANPTLQIYNSNYPGPKTFTSKTLSFTKPVGSIIKERVFIKTQIIDTVSPTRAGNYIEFYSTYGTSNFFKITKLKMEKGTVATDWTPAPEDARTYKAWANSSEGSVDFTRVYPNENLISKVDIIEKSYTNATGAVLPLANTFTTEKIEVTSGVEYTLKNHSTLAAKGIRIVEYNSSGAMTKYDNLFSGVGTVKLALTTTHVRVNVDTLDGTYNNDAKLEQDTTPTIYTTNPADSLTGSIPKYVGFSPLDSSKSSDYEWIINPEWTQASAEESLTNKADKGEIDDINNALGGKVDNDTFQGVQEIAEEFAKSYEAFISDDGKHKKDLEALEKRIELMILELGDKVLKLDFIKTHMTAGDEGLLIGSKDSSIKMLLSSNSLTFIDGKEKLAEFSGQSFTVEKGSILQDVQIGEHKASKFGNGQTVFQWVK